MKAESSLGLVTELLTDLRQIQLQLIQWFPSLANRVSQSGLRHMITRHSTESAEHLTLLEQFFINHGTQPAEGISKAINLIIDDSDGNIPDIRDPDRSDLVLVIQMLRVEQFEITAYGIVARVAEQLGFSEDADMLIEFLGQRDTSASILRDLQSEMLVKAFPMDVRPGSPFPD